LYRGLDLIGKIVFLFFCLAKIDGRLKKRLYPRDDVR
jgi:hypothetical protein